ncbi:MAG: calcium/sodium antiporter [Bacteroidales bacterium]|nr:calcium/sodium antiporter [Bacteroidales bacterium]
MLVQILILLAGLALVVFGADYLVDGASDIARRAGLSEFVIGLTIVGIGTSMPELVVSVVGAIQGNSDVAVGNVMGSNILNILLILGLTTLIRPVPITKENRKRDDIMHLCVVFLLYLIQYDIWHPNLNEPHMMQRWEGILFLVLFAIYMDFSFQTNKPVEEKDDPASALPVPKLLPSLLMVIGGLAGLIIGGRLFVNSAMAIAKMVGMSDSLIAATILAGGTSVPELATCIVAAIKGRGQLAYGNIIGSNISNILLILGASAVIHPLTFFGIGSQIYTAFISSAVLLSLGVHLSKRRGVLGRGMGIAMLLFFGLYLFNLFS